MKVLLAITKGETGGAQEHLRILAKGLVERGHTIGVAATMPSSLGEALPREVHVFPWRNIVRNPHPLRDVQARRELHEIVTAFRPDILHLYSAKAGLLGRRLEPDLVTVYTSHHTPYGPGRKWAHRLVSRPIEQLTLRYLDGIITDGARDAPLLRKLAPDVPLRIVPNGIEPPATPLSPPDPVKVALWVARMRHPKDPLQAVKAWRYVAQRHPDARLIMCGEGPLLDRVRSAVASSPVGANIEVLGRVPDLESQRARASIFLLATDVEGGTTMATLEAMAHGLVPVISDAGDAFMLDRSACGVVVPRRSPQTLARAIASLFDEPEVVRAMRDRAIEFATRSWTGADMARETEQFYEDLLT